MNDLLAQKALTDTETVLVTDAGFAPAPVHDTLDLGSDATPEDLLGALTSNQIVRIDFPSFADGRGFTLARRLRQMGFTGHLRAKGHVLADQYAMARRSGFDDVEIDRALATRQPEDQWLDRANWQKHDLRSRLRAA